MKTNNLISLLKNEVEEITKQLKSDKGVFKNNPDFYLGFLAGLHAVVERAKELTGLLERKEYSEVIMAKYTITGIDTEQKLQTINKHFGTQLTKVPVEVTIENDEFVKRAEDGMGNWQESMRVPYHVWEEFIDW